MCMAGIFYSFHIYCILKMHIMHFTSFCALYYCMHGWLADAVYTKTIFLYSFTSIFIRNIYIYICSYIYIYVYAPFSVYTVHCTHILSGGWWWFFSMSFIYRFKYKHSLVSTTCKPFSYMYIIYMLCIYYNIHCTIVHNIILYKEKLSMHTMIFPVNRLFIIVHENEMLKKKKTVRQYILQRKFFGYITAPAT